MHFVNAYAPIVVTLSGIVMLVRPLLIKAFPSMVVTLSGIFISFRALQPEKAAFPILVIPLEIVTFFRDEQPEKTEPSMLVTPPGIVTSVKPVQPEKAFIPMLVTVPEIEIFVRPVQPKKAPPRMVVTPIGTTEFLQPKIKVLLFVSIIALQFLRLSNTVLSGSTVMLATLVQFENASPSIFVTPAGIFMLSNSKQLINVR